MKAEEPERLLAVRLRPGAGRERVAGEKDGELRVEVCAAAVAGKANRALIKLLARRLRIPQNRIEIVRGLTSRRKLLRIEGMSPQAIRVALLPPTGR